MNRRQIVPSLATLLALSLPALAQSGRATLHGYVAFEDVAYVDKQPTATVELFGVNDKKFEHALASAKTNEHGQYEIASPALGEAVLRITAAGFEPYVIPIYMPSDFSGNLATLLKKSPAATQK